MGKGLPHSLDGADINVGSVTEVNGLKMNWRGYWTATRYDKNDMVLDGTWLMVANKETLDRAAPQVTGPPQDGIVGDPAWSVPASTGVVYSGHKYTFIKGGRIAAVKVWVPSLGANIRHRVFIRDITFGEENAITTEIASEVTTEDSWVEISLGGQLVNFGAIIQIFVESQNVTGSTVTNANWTQDVDIFRPPPIGHWKRDFFQFNLFYIADIDDDSIDRSGLFAGLMIGDTIKFTDSVDSDKYITFELTDTPVEVVGEGYFNFRGTPVQQGPNGQPDESVLSLGEITEKITASIDYVEAVDYWLSNSIDFATVEGFVTIDGAQIVALENNAYGIDVIFRGGTLSPDWDLAANTATVG